jgi:hypothetical protein
MVVMLVGHHDEVRASERILHSLVAVLKDRHSGVRLHLAIYTGVYHDPTGRVANLEDRVGSLDDIVRCACDGVAERGAELGEFQIAKRVRQFSGNRAGGGPHLEEKSVREGGTGSPRRGGPCPNRER